MTKTPTDADAEVTEEMVMRARTVHIPSLNASGYLHAEDARKVLSAALAGDGFDIACSEAMPDTGLPVMVYAPNRYGWESAIFLGDEWQTIAGSMMFPAKTVTHWKHMPRRPALDATREGGK